VQYAGKSSGRTIAVRYDNGMELCEATDLVVEG
jgi:predicted DNA-binding protein with PD1-like motif